MKPEQPLSLNRDCEAVLVPSGEKVALRAGTQVRVTQALGGSYTVTTEQGRLLRIAEKDADAIGISRGAHFPKKGPMELGAGESVEKLVWEQLRTCFDPEIPVNIVDMGLVYECQVSSTSAAGSRVTVRFTLTAPGCGMGEVLKGEIRGKILGIPGVAEVDVALVWDPPWNQGMMSESAKRDLGMV